MKKKELAKLAGVSTYTINKVNKNENVTWEVLGKICKALDFRLDDIMKFEEYERWAKKLQKKLEKKETTNSGISLPANLKIDSNRGKNFK